MSAYKPRPNTIGERSNIPMKEPVFQFMLSCSAPPVEEEVVVLEELAALSTTSAGTRERVGTAEDIVFRILG